MAENESLDLTTPYARRWKPALEALLKGESCEKIASLTERALKRAINNAIKWFAQHRVSIADFLSSRHSPSELRRLVNRTLNNSFAEHLASVLVSNPSASNTDCVYQWLHDILDRVFDQFKMKVAGTDQLPSFRDAESALQDVRCELMGNLDSVAISIVNNPLRKLTVRSKKGEVIGDPTADLLPVSLVGGPSQ
jgi:hypothetical protein